LHVHHTDKNKNNLFRAKLLDANLQLSFFLGDYVW